MSAMPKSSTSSGLPRMKRAPVDAVAASSRKALPLLVTRGATKPVSGMSRAQARPQAIVTAPLASTAARSETAPSPTNDERARRRSPRSASRAPRRKTFGTRSIPTSSVIHASYAPLVNV